MKPLPTTDKPVIQAELRRTSKSDSAAQYEVLHEGQILDRRGSVAHDFHGALLGLAPDGKWSRLSYHAKPGPLAAALGKAQRDLKWPVQ